jgi:hypothetical protein
VFLLDFFTCRGSIKRENCFFCCFIVEKNFSFPFSSAQHRKMILYPFAAAISGFNLYQFKPSINPPPFVIAQEI